MNPNEQQTERPTLVQLYQAVEAAVSRQQVHQILKDFTAYQDSQPDTDRRHNGND